MFQVPATILKRTFDVFRECGNYRRECYALWTSPWEKPGTISSLVHPQHQAHGGAFNVDPTWLNSFWSELADTGNGIRVQVHTHPHEAFHSSVDDDYPIIHSVGFLSLVVPDFGAGPVGFEKAFLAEIGPDGRWREVNISSTLEIV